MFHVVIQWMWDKKRRVLMVVVGKSKRMGYLDKGYGGKQAWILKDDCWGHINNTIKQRIASRIYYMKKIIESMMGDWASGKSLVPRLKTTHLYPQRHPSQFGIQFPIPGPLNFIQPFYFQTFSNSIQYLPTPTESFSSPSPAPSPRTHLPTNPLFTKPLIPITHIFNHRWICSNAIMILLLCSVLILSFHLSLLCVPNIPLLPQNRTHLRHYLPVRRSFERVLLYHPRQQTRELLVPATHCLSDSLEFLEVITIIYDDLLFQSLIKSAAREHHHPQIKNRCLCLGCLSIHLLIRLFSQFGFIAEVPLLSALLFLICQVAGDQVRLHHFYLPVLGYECVLNPDVEGALALLQLHQHFDRTQQYPPQLQDGELFVIMMAFDNLFLESHLFILQEEVDLGDGCTEPSLCFDPVINHIDQTGGVVEFLGFQKGLHVGVVCNDFLESVSGEGCFGLEEGEFAITAVGVLLDVLVVLAQFLLN